MSESSEELRQKNQQESTMKQLMMSYPQSGVKMSNNGENNIFCNLSNSYEDSICIHNRNQQIFANNIESSNERKNF
jgi:hypothetical protein